MLSASSHRVSPVDGRLPLTYVLPLRWTDTEDVGDLTAYLAELRRWVTEVLVVDGSPDSVFAELDAHLPAGCAHMSPDPRLSFRMGKVNGVMTGLREASCEKVVIADDDVRWDRAGLTAVAAHLDRAHLVRPHNFFDPLPWHARWETGRILLNRAFTGDPGFPRGDFPGTFGLRRGFLVSRGGYDGDVMFENLQLMRTVRVAGGVVFTPPGLYVARRPPSTSHFLSQRVRQAYDDLAMPLRLLGFLSVAPAVALAILRRRFSALVGGAGLIALTAEAGRWADGGRRFYPASGSLLAPLWVCERGVCSWLALRARARGGVRYAGSVIPRAADSEATLRREGSAARARNPVSL